MSVSNEDETSHDGPADEFSASVRATLQHIELLSNRIAKLTDAKDQAERQVLHRVGCAYRDGSMGIAELIAFFQQYRRLATDKKAQRWNESIDLQYKALLHQLPPNGPADTWVGEWPHIDGEPYPISGISVVYVLFDATNEPCYVGSTSKLRPRLSEHTKAGKLFVRWQAYPCRDREHAYEIEDRLLKHHLPRLNRRAGR